jgi:hypothetical protein
MKKLTFILCALAVGCGNGVPENKRFPLTCDPVTEAVAADDGSDLPAEPTRSLAGRDHVLTVLMPPSGRSLVDVRRLVQQLEGWGYTLRFGGVEDIPTASTVVIASSAYEEIGLGADGVAALEAACANGVDIVWFGLGLPTALADELGVDVPAAGPMELAQEVRLMTLENDPVVVDLAPGEWMQPLTPRGAQTIASLDGGRALLTTHRASPSSCRATALPYAFGDNWSEDGSENAWARVELVHEAIVRGTSSGTAMIELFPAPYRAIYMLRFEDLHPGGTRYNLNNPFFRERFERVIATMGDFGFRVNLSVVPRFVDPARNEDSGWNDEMTGRAELRDALYDAIDQHGASLIAHGFTHQNGVRETDYTGQDWELSDDSTGEWVFIPMEQQRLRMEASRAELEDIFDVTPRVWETPHLDSNEDTFAAVSEVGFDIVNERDGGLFPRLLTPGHAINVPHNASFVPAEHGAQPWTEQAIRSVMPRMFRMRAPFFFFYHGFDDLQESAVGTTAACASAAGAWGPTVEQLADRWAERSVAGIEVSHVDEHTMHVSLTSAPEQTLLRVRIPEGHHAISVSVDGVPFAFESQRRNGVAFAVVALERPDADIVVVHRP